MKTVDVIVPCLNGEAFILRALESLINQTHEIENIYVINDGSTDNTRSLVEEMVRTHQSIKLINQENRGLSASRNVGLKLSNSDYVAFLDADDAWKPTKIENQLKSLQENLSAVGVASLYSYTSDFVKFNPGNCPKHEITSLNLLCRKSFIPGSASSILIKREIIQDALTFDETLPYAEDLDFAIRLLDFGNIVICPEYDVQIFHSSNGIQSNVIKNPNPAIISLLRIIEKNRWRISPLQEYLLMIDVYWQFWSSSLKRLSLRSLLLLRIREISSRTSTSIMRQSSLTLLSLPLGLVRGIQRKLSSHF